MKCPNCGYVGVIKNTEDKTKTLGACGDFFEPEGNSMQLQRQHVMGGPIDIASIVGCPHCKKLFIDN